MDSPAEATFPNEAEMRKVHLMSRNITVHVDASKRLGPQDEGLSGRKSVHCTHYRIDKDHSNAYAEWQRQGEPWFPDETQYKAIKARDSLEKYEEDQVLPVEDGKITLTFPMPAHAVSYLVLK